MDITVLFPYLRSTCNLALSCTDFNRVVRSNGFPIRTSYSGLTLDNWRFYKLLNCPEIDIWMNREVFRALKDQPSRLQLLLDTGADVETKAKDGYRAIHWAVIFGRPKCLELLLDRGVDIEAVNDGEFTALHWAGVYGRAQCIKILLDRGANIEAVIGEGNTALAKAAIYGFVGCMRILLERGAKIHPNLRKNYPDYAELWEEFS